MEDVMYWNRKPGKFVNKRTGKSVTLATELSTGPVFTGSTQEWYETLVETLIDMRNTLHRQARRNADQVTVTVDPDTMTFLKCNVLFRPANGRRDRGTISDMEIVEDRRGRRLQALVEFKHAKEVLEGTVKILED